MKSPLSFLVLFLMFSLSATAGTEFALQAPTPQFDALLGFRAIEGTTDLTGDGFGDLLVGSLQATPGNLSQAGAVFLFDGRTGQHVRTFQSPTPEVMGWFGHAVVSISDVTGDGIPEIACAATLETVGGIRGAGKVHIFNGVSGSLLRTIETPNPAANGEFGIGLDTVPDVNGDGVEELAVGSLQEFVGVSDSGRAYLFDPTNGALIHSFVSPAPENQGRFGLCVAGISDLDGDGGGEVIVGAYQENVGALNEAGRVYVFNGIDGGLLYTLVSPGAADFSLLGFQAAAIPDVNGDGIPDIAAGAQAETDAGVVVAGRVHLYDGATGGFIRTLSSPVPTAVGLFGVWVAGAPDVNGNGAGEVLVGAEGEASGCVGAAGRAYLYDGATGEMLRQFDSGAPEDAGIFGFTLQATPDANGDGHFEVAIAAAQETVQGQANAGRVYMFYSPLFEPGNDGVALDDCRNACGLAGSDGDEDGLIDCIEDCLGTSRSNLDTDGDGMPDGFEAEAGLDPLIADAEVDADGDGLTNIEEYVRNSSPTLATDPAPVFFVRPDGVDDPGRGSREQPWRTLNFALSQVTGAAGNPARIVVLCGDYDEDLILKPFVSIEGLPTTETHILGNVTGAAGANLAHLTIASSGVLLNLSDATTVLDNVRFSGTAAGATGVQVQGVVTPPVLLDHCVFTGLAVGLDITGALPILRRSIFENCSEAGIVVHDIAAKSATKTLGDQTDVRTGFNTFRDNPNLNVVNEDSETTLSLERNDWDTNDAGAIDASITGPKDFEPFLAAGSGVLAGSLFCTVWDAASQGRIQNASVSLAPSAFAPVSENVDGVYAFPALDSGAYTVSVSAEGYPTTTKNVSIGDGQLVSLSVPLDVGGGGGGGCRAGSSPQDGSLGDALVALVSLLLLSRFSARRRRNGSAT